MASARQPLSQTAAGIAWLRQFRPIDQPVAADFADTLILLNETDVAATVRAEIAALARTRSRRRRVVAVYPEREFATKSIFDSALRPGRDGTIRMRAYGEVGPAPIVGRRGSARVGSEGSMASIVSQAVDASRKLVNRPGPDRIRTRKVDLVVIATDFIGSGDRVVSMLDKFLQTPSVRAWRSNGWIDFAVVAAAGTAAGIAAIERHRTKPIVRAPIVAPTVHSFRDPARTASWRRLVQHYGPRFHHGAGPLGYKGSASLIAFSYRTPNNTPLIFHARAEGWVPLLDGAASDDLRPAFGLPSLEERVWAGTDDASRRATDLMIDEARMGLVLRSIRGKWRAAQSVEMAERTGLTVPEVVGTVARALGLRLLNEAGRLTDRGQALLHDGKLRERRDKIVPTHERPYYPEALRAPR
jgi:hypothetical protein